MIGMLGGCGLGAGLFMRGSRSFDCSSVDINMSSLKGDGFHHLHLVEDFRLYLTCGDVSYYADETRRLTGYTPL
jgi:hypothetical protein